MLFANKEHQDFYIEQTAFLPQDRYHQSLVYTVGICPDTRRNFQSLYVARDRSINPEAINAAWQTGGSLKVTRLAFQLFTDGAPTAYPDNAPPDIKECEKYSVSDIFACGYAPYFVEAIRLRYPEYLKTEKE